jgi:hypothetical protein
MSDPEDDGKKVRFIFIGHIEDLADHRLAELELDCRILLLRIQKERQDRLARKGKRP